MMRAVSFEGDSSDDKVEEGGGEGHLDSRLFVFFIEFGIVSCQKATGGLDMVDERF